MPKFAAPVRASATAPRGGAPLPARLRRHYELAAGVSLAHVRVFRDSPIPARHGALATTSGGRIDISRGAEWTLRHEAWHAAQAALGLVGGRPGAENASPRLEAQADAMAARAPDVAVPAGGAGGSAASGGLLSAPVQCVKPKVYKDKTTGQHWYRDERGIVQSFGTRQEAIDHWTARNERHTTMYTYQVSSNQTQLSAPTPFLLDKPQGPHTISHVATKALLDDGIDQRVAKGQTTEQAIDYLWTNHVAKPLDVTGIMNTEVPTWATQPRLAKAVADYSTLHTSYGKLRRTRSRLSAMLERHPYKTYAWKTGKAASKKSLKGKAERYPKSVRSAADMKGLFDQGYKKTGFNKAKFRKYVENHLRMALTKSEAAAILTGWSL